MESVLEVPRLDPSRGKGESPATGGIRFGRIAPSVGARWSVSLRAKSRAGVDTSHGTELQLSEYVSAYAVEILATNGPAPSQVRVTFEANVHHYQGIESPTSIHGKAYVVDATAPHVRDTSGAAPPEEAQRVLDVMPELGTRTQIDQVLPDAAMAIGDDRHELAGAILRVIHPRLWTLNSGTAVLSRAEGDEAVFAIALDATGQSGVRLVVKGEAHVRLRDARLTSIDLEGTYADPTSTAPGSFSLRRTVRDL